MIGNDIIDLHTASLSHNLKRQRYLDKLFTPKEQELINSSASPEKQVHLLWAMKEAAWKAHQRKHNLPRKFAPKDLVCDVFQNKNGFLNGAVQVEAESYVTKTSVSNSYLHCIAFSPPQPEIITEILPASTDVKTTLVNRIADIYKLPKKGFFFKKDINFIPHLHHDAVKTGFLFSLSGHGRFSAFSLELINS